MQQVTVCPGCGVSVLSIVQELDGQLNASAACRELYYDLSSYTLQLQDPSFIHQLAVDAYAAQHAGERVKAITVAFAVVGLYLVWERGYTGKEVQRAHMALAARSRMWPRLPRPNGMAALTVRDVVRAPPDGRREAIRAWSSSVWSMWKPQEPRVADLLGSTLEP